MVDWSKKIKPISHYWRILLLKHKYTLLHIVKKRKILEKEGLEKGKRILF
jgi:hypothetical protein